MYGLLHSSDCMTCVVSLSDWQYIQELAGRIVIDRYYQVIHKEHLFIIKPTVISMKS